MNFFGRALGKPLSRTERRETRLLLGALKNENGFDLSGGAVAQ